MTSFKFWQISKNIYQDRDIVTMED